MTHSYTQRIYIQELALLQRYRGFVGGRIEEGECEGGTRERSRDARAHTHTQSYTGGEGDVKKMVQGGRGEEGKGGRGGVEGRGVWGGRGGRGGEGEEGGEYVCVDLGENAFHCPFQPSILLQVCLSVRSSCVFYDVNVYEYVRIYVSDYRSINLSIYLSTYLSSTNVCACTCMCVKAYTHAWVHI